MNPTVVYVVQAPLYTPEFCFFMGVNQECLHLPTQPRNINDNDTLEVSG